MPFLSQAQRRFAFATDQPWADRWAKETPDMKKLPEYVTKKKKARGGIQDELNKGGVNTFQKKRNFLKGKIQKFLK